MDANTQGQLELILKRIFSMPVTKSTFRQLQHAILTLMNGNREESNAMLESLVTGQAKGKNADNGQLFKRLSEQYGISILVAKDIFERGDYLSLLSSDIVALQQGRVVLNNIIRRVDGTEFQLITDIDSSINVIQHFISRLEELMNLKEHQQLQDHLVVEFEKIHEQLGKWLASAKH